MNSRRNYEYPGIKPPPHTFKNTMRQSNNMKSIIALICLLSFTRAENSVRALRNVDNHRDLSQDKLSQVLNQEPVLKRETERELRSYRGRNSGKKGWDPVYEEDGKERRRKGNKKPKHKGPKKAEKVEECDDHGDKKNPRDCRQGLERSKTKTSKLTRPSENDAPNAPVASPVRAPGGSRPYQEPDNQESAGTPTRAPFATGKVDAGIKPIPNPNPSPGGFRPILPAANAPAPTPSTSDGGNPDILPSVPSSPPVIAQTTTPSAPPVDPVGAFTFPPVTSPGSPTFAPTEQETVPVPTAAIVQEETPAPSAEFVEEVHEKQQGPVREASVEADTTLVKMVGIFDPVRAEPTIFSEMEDIMQPYFRAFGGPAQDRFELDVTFYHEYNAMETIDGSITMTTYFDVQVTFELSSTDIDEVTSFSKSEATQLVEEFFEGNNLLRLKRRLTQAGVKVTDVDIVDSLPNSSSTGQDETVTGRNKGSAEPVYKTPADEPSKDRIALLAAMASGGLVMLFFASVLLISTHRRARQAIGSVVGHLSVIDDSSSAPSYSDSTFDQSRPLSASDMSAPRIKPSALQERRKREEQKQAVQEQVSQRSFDDFSSSSYGEYDDTERLEDGLVSSGALTCLDTEPQYNVSTDYPEFSMYTHLPPATKPALPLMYPPSPQWSSTGSEYTSAADSREYAEQRRRWHDQANDLALLALPDHASEAEGSNDESDEIATRDSSGASTTQQSTDSSSSSSSSSSTSSSTEEQSQISRPGPEHFMVD